MGKRLYDSLSVARPGAFDSAGVGRLPAAWLFGEVDCAADISPLNAADAGALDVDEEAKKSKDE